MRFCLFVLFALSLLLEGRTSAQNVILLNITELSGPPVMAIKAAAGLLNRNDANVYTTQDSYDDEWLSALLPNATLDERDPMTFLNASLFQFGGILYNQTLQDLIPSVVTMAGILGAVPLDLDLYALYPQTPIVLDTTTAWAGYNAREAVVYTAGAGLNDTSSVAFQSGSLLVSSGELVDYLVMRKIFTQYLPNGCLPGSPDHQIFKAIIDASPWPRPVRVFGYNSADVIFGGDLFEAETDCVSVLGQVATSHSNNLAFWTHVAPFAPGEALVQPVAEEVAYDSSKTYIALVYGDMDNVDFVQSFGSDHMRYRAAMCANITCFPLTWTLSPNLITFSPAMMRWYFSMAESSHGRDWFIMPPSGTLYSYPGLMPPEVQANYVEQQNAQAFVMNTTGSIHWEWMFTWDFAFDNYFPRYINVTQGTKGFFLNDVPWPVPIPDMFLHGENYKFIGDPKDENVVTLFRPAFNWQLDGPSGGLPYNASVIADLINKFKIGTVQYIYVIQNTDIESLFEMTTLLDPHVELVSYTQLMSLARQRG